MFSYRCSRCKKRKSFHRPLAAYVHTPKGVARGTVDRCTCGGHLYSTDKEIRRTQQRQTKCECGLIPFPHRAGSTHHEYGMCAQHADFDPWGSGRLSMASRDT